MNRLETLRLLEEGRITFDEAKRRLAKPDRPPMTRPVWRFLLKVESHGKHFTLWLPWAPLALVAGLALPIGWGPMKRQMLRESVPGEIGLGQVLMLLARVSAVGGGLLVHVRSANGETVRIAM